MIPSIRLGKQAPDVSVRYLLWLDFVGVISHDADGKSYVTKFKLSAAK